MAKSTVIEGSMTLEEMLDILTTHGFNPEYTPGKGTDFNRIIKFKSGSVHFEIIWFKNHSTLLIKNSMGAPICLPFKWIFHDTTYPMIGQKINNSLGFSFTKNSKSPEYPFEVFRIPIPEKKDKEEIERNANLEAAFQLGLKARTLIIEEG